MPGLRFYGRKWQFGADDMVVPSCLCSLSRVTWATLLSLFIYASKRAAEDCSEEVVMYTTVALASFCVSFLVYFSMLVVSLRGTVLEVEKRWCMPGLFKMLTVCLIVEATLAVYGTYLAAFGEDPCETESSVPYDALRAVVIGSWVDIFFASCCGCLGLTISSADDDYHEQRKVGKGTDIRQSGDEAASSAREQSARCCYWWGNAKENEAETPLLSGDAPRSISSQAPPDADDVAEEEEDQYDFDSDEEREADAHTGSVLVGEHQAVSNGFLAGEEALDEEDYDDLGRTPQTWNRRCRRLCAVFQCFTCGIFGGMNGTGGPNAFQEVAVVLAGWFKNLDLVPSDIVAALFLMRAEQRQMEANAVQALLRERLNSRNDRSRRRAFTHVGRWMWTSHGPNERANSQLHAQQIRESRDARRLRVHSTASDLDGGGGGEESFQDVFDLDPEAKELLLHASDMAPYMLGMYGWLLFSYMQGVQGWVTLFLRPFTRCCRRASSSKPSSSSASPSDRDDGTNAMVSQFLSPSSDASGQRHARHLFVLDDGCCQWNTAALVERVGRKSAAKADVVYASFTSFSGQAVPYSVCVDHAKRRVVVAVRGTFTIADAITHVTMVPVPLMPHAKRWGFVDDIEPDSHAHAGILRIAAWMRADLQRHDILHRLFGISARGETGSPSGTAWEQDPEDVRRERAFSVDANELPDCRGYGLDITGHSLGAGVAVVLSLFLRPAFPNVRCMAFSPPGCVFDWKLANKCSSWVSCVFVGKDFAPRLSWHSLFTLRAQVLDTLRRDKATKAGAIVSAIAGRNIDQLLYRSDEVPDTKHAREMERKIDELANRKPTVLDSVRLYAPGKLLHLMKDETVTTNCCRRQQHFVPMWVDDRSALDEILLSSRMALDHFPDVVDSVLRGVVEEYCSS